MRTGAPTSATTDDHPTSGREEKIGALKQISYADFLTRCVKTGEEAVAFLQTGTHDNWGVGIDAVSAFAAAEEGSGDYGLDLFPGFDGMDLGPRSNRSSEFLRAD